MTNEIKAIIVEDVITYLDTIEKLINKATSEVIVIGKSTNLSEAKNLILQ
jgi:hypothetical protein